MCEFDSEGFQGLGKLLDYLDGSADYLGTNAICGDRSYAVVVALVGKREDGSLSNCSAVGAVGAAGAIHDV